jgi:hypothetical protein
MILGQETTPKIPFHEAERPPTSAELALWAKADRTAKRVRLLAYMAKAQYKNLTLTHDFMTANSVPLDEPELPDLIERMFAALYKVDDLSHRMCDVNNHILGVRISASGKDLDIVEPQESGLGWILPAVIGAVIVVGIIARWAHLEQEITEVTAAYNGVLKRTDIALCQDPTSKLCKDWDKAKSSGGYYRRENVIDSVKNAVSAIGQGAKKGISWALPLAIPLLLWLYMPRRKER